MESPDLWKKYRSSFNAFAQSVKNLEAIASDPASQYDRSRVDSALLELEDARLAHSNARDRLAATLFAGFSSAPRVASCNERVRRVAKLLWEFSGRPEGTSTEDWLRAEQLIRSASATATSPRAPAW